MLFAAAWKNLETVILNKVIQRKPNIYHLYMESKKKNRTNELIYKTEIDLQLEKTNMITRG